MVANKEYVLQLMKEKKMSMGNLAQRAGVSKTTISRWLSGKRGAGRDLMTGLRKAFPNEPIEKLFFFSPV